MPEVPDLVIPIRMDPTKAKAGLQQVSAAGRKAGDEIAASGRKAKEGLDSADKSAMNLGQQLGGVAKAAIGLGIARQIAGDIGRSFEGMAKDIEASAKEFQKLREALQAVASLTNQKNTNKFAASEIAAAEKANVTPEEYTRSRKAFLAKASLYIGEGPEAKLGTEDANEFQSALAEFAKQKGVGQEEMAGFAGGLLEQQKGKTTAAEMKKRAGKVFATLEASSTDVSKLLPQMTRTMAQGFSAEDAAATLAGAPSYAPEEEGTYVLRAVSALREKILDDAKAEKHGKEIEGLKASELGLKKGQTPYEMLTSTIKNLEERKRKGEDIDEILSELAPEQISQKALRGMLDQGSAGFDRWRGLVEQTPDDQLNRVITEGRGTEAGKQYRVDAAQATSHARQGIRGDEVTRWRQIADTELTESGAYERMDVGAETAGFVAGQLGGPDAKTWKQNRQMIARARAIRGEEVTQTDRVRMMSQTETDRLVGGMLDEMKGGDPGALPGALKPPPIALNALKVRENEQMIGQARSAAGQESEPTDRLAARSQGSTDALLRQLIDLQRENNRLQAEQKKQPAAAVPTVLGKPGAGNDGRM